MDILGNLSRYLDILQPESVQKVLLAFREYLMPLGDPKIV